MNILEEWSKLRGVGYWRCDENTELPHPADLVDHEWDRTEREIVVEYLLRGFSDMSHFGGCSYCRLCDPDAAVCDNGSTHFTDGTWIWPEGFSHYVEDHDVRPSVEFVAWVLTHSEEARARPRHIVRKPERGRRRPIVTQSAIDELLAQAHLVRVTEGTWPRRTGKFSGQARDALKAPQPDHEKSSSSPRTNASADDSARAGRTGGRPEIDALGRGLTIRESPHRRRLMADEDGSRHEWESEVCIVLEGRSCATIHVSEEGRLIDCVEWAWGAQVQDERGLLRWIASMGIPYPLRQVEDGEAFRAKEAAAREAWRAAAPPCIRGIFQVHGSRGRDLLEQARIALRDAYPTKAEGFVALFRWLGSTEPMGDTGYDEVIFALLEQSSLSATLEAVEDMELDAVALKGVGRLVVYWATGRSPGAARAIPSPAMRRRLLDLARHESRSGNYDALVAALS